MLLSGNNFASWNSDNVLACGYYLEDSKIEQLNTFLDEKKATRIDLNTMLLVLTHLKEIELMLEQENESDEYCKLLWVWID